MNTAKTTLFTALILISSVLIAQNRNPIGLPYTNQLIDVSQSSVKLQNTFRHKSQTFSNVRKLTEINDTLLADAYPWISGDGLSLYYISGDSSFTNNALMYTSRPNVSSQFGVPIQVQFNGIGPDFGFWLSDDQLEIYYYSLVTNTMYYANRATIQSPFGLPTSIAMLGSNVAPSLVSSISLDSNRMNLYMYVTAGIASHYIEQYSLTSTNTYSYIRNLTSPLPLSPGPGQLSNDGLAYYYSTYLDSIRLSDSKLCMVTRASPTDTFDVNSFCFLSSINDTSTYNGMPSVSDNEDWIVFARSSDGTWFGNELYIAGKSSVTSLKANTTLDGEDKWSIYPNPASDRVNININASASERANARIKLFDDKGRLISEIKYSKELDLSTLSKGLYVIQMVMDDKLYSKRLVIN